MLSFIINALLGAAVNKPKITKDVVVAALYAATAFLMFSIAVGYSLSVIKELIIATAKVNPLLAELYMAGGCLLVAALLAYVAKRLFFKAKMKREAPIDKIMDMVDAFMEGFNNPPEQQPLSTMKSNISQIRKTRN